MYTTLISAADLAARLSAPGLVIVDVRHDLGQPGSGRGVRAHRPRSLGAEDRPQRPAPAALA
jgi:hypothetical protein